MKKKCLEMAPGLLFPWLSAFLLFLVIYLAFPTQLGIHQKEKYHLLIGAAVTLLFSDFWILDGLKKIWSLLLAGALMLVIHLLAGFSRMAEFWQDYGNWLAAKPCLHEEWYPIFIVFQCLWIALAAGMLWKIIHHFQQWMGIYSLALFGAVLIGGIVKFSMPTPGVAATLSFALYLGTMWQLGKGREQRNAQFMFFMAPVFLLMVLLLGVMPSSQNPYSWPVSRKILQRVGEKLEGISNSLHRFSYNFHIEGWDTSQLVDSFEDRAKLRDEIQQNKQVLFDLYYDGNARTTLYLIGNMWKEFDGREWQEEVTDFADDLRTDTRQTLYGIYRTTNYWGDYEKEVPVQITYQNFHSEKPFVPLKIKTVSDVELPVGKNGYLGYGSGYSFTYVMMNLRHPIFVQLINEAGALEDNMTAWRYSGSGQKAASLEYMAGYIGRTSLEYTSPIQITKELEEWKEETIEAYKEKQISDGFLLPGQELSSYERLLAMEQAMAEWKYNTTPGAVPEQIKNKEDFLQFFVLESREGYCLHYATAMALLVQSEGLPVRLCQGFCIPLGTEQHIEVTADMAHAWPEVYFESVGWIPLEPTPGYGSLRYQPWKVNDHFDASDHNKEQVWDAYLEQMDEKHRAEEEARRLEEEERRQKKEETQALLRGEKNREILLAISNLLWNVVVGVIVFIVLAVICLIIYVIWRRNRYRKMKLEERLRYLSLRNLYLLEQMGVKRDTSETLEELGRRIEEYKLPGGRTLKCMEEIRYGQRKADQEILKEVFEERKQITQELKNQTKKKLFCYLEKIYIASLEKYV